MAKYVPRERKHRRLAKQKNSHAPADDNSNVQEVVPESKTEREVRRSKLAADLREQQQQSKISSKKRKRLDKYVDTKLRREENLELLKKLATHKVDTSLLQSSKKLGRVHETKRERYARALQERSAGLDVDGSHDAVLFQRRREAEPSAEASENDDSESQQGEADTVLRTARPTATVATGFGSGLKRPLEMDDAGQPVIKKRKRRKGKVAAPQLAVAAMSESDEGAFDVTEESDGDSDDEWAGFESDGAPVDDALGASSTTSETDLDEDESSGNDDDDESDSESAPSVESDKKGRVSAFKQWADTQRNAAVDFTPSAAPENDAAILANFKPRQASPDPTLANMQANGERTSRPAAAITISRSEEIQATRLELPVVQEEQKIMEAVHSNPIVIICGATGSGKTTQVPQMMFESGYGSHINDKSALAAAAGPQSRGMIGVTQPRRVAAVSVAERVATELGPSHRNRVAHHVRYSNNVTRNTAMKFMTDGTLLREISQDFALSKYSAIVIDEAHERSVNTDILIGMLSRIVSLRSELAKEEPDKHYPLKLVIMSATLRVSDFSDNALLFRDGPPPIVQAEGRQYPVTVHFSRKTQRDFVTETVEKVARGHRKLPPGGMLVFLTGQDEIQTVGRQLRDRLGGNTAGSNVTKAKDDELDDFEDGISSKRNNDYLEGEEELDSDSEAEITGLDPDAQDQEFEVENDQPQFGPRHHGVLKPHILPLHAKLPSAQQLRVFQPAPAGSRLIVLATNVAETSLTIPGIRYVFDCGRAKEKVYDVSTGVQTFEIDWISKASASQRSGRAGRTGPGHCYRLYSSAVYEQFFAEHTVPEILRTPLESTVLQLKSMQIENVVNFPFPTSPDVAHLAQAESLLKSLGAIGASDGLITQVGKEIMGFPVSPRFGKMLWFAMKNNVVAHVIALVAGLAVGDLFVPEAQVAGASAAEHDGLSDVDSSDDDGRTRRRAEKAVHTAGQERHQAYTRAQATLSHMDEESDSMKVLTAVAAHADASGKDKLMSAASKFCDDYFLREKAMAEVQHLRHQLHNIVSARDSTMNVPFTNLLPPPTDKEMRTLNQIVTAGFIDQIAIRADLLKDDTPSNFGRKPRRANEVAYRTLVPSAATDVDKTLSPQDQEIQRSVFVHSSSVLAKLSVKEMPPYIVYSHLSRASPATVESAKIPRTRMHPLTTVQAPVLAKLAEGTPLLGFGKPIGKIEELSPGRRQCWVSLALKAPAGGMEWPLGAWKVIQRRGVRDWVVESVVAR